MKPSSISLPFSLALLVTATTIAYAQTNPPNGHYEAGGSACVVAKKLGNSMAIQWATGEPSVAEAIDKAKQELNNQGYEFVFPQSNSNFRHGWIVIIKTRYRTYTGRERTSYGCGFDQLTVEAAEQRALSNLRSYSWGWKPSLGYEVIEKNQY